MAMLSLAAVGGITATYGKFTRLSEKVDSVSTKIASLTENELPHMDAKLDRIIKDYNERMEKCVTHDLLLSQLTQAMERLHPRNE